MEQVRVHGPAQLCREIPALMGYTPVDSLLVVLLDAKDFVVCVARCDLATADPEQLRPALYTSGAVGAIIVTYTSFPVYGMLVDLFANFLDVHDLDVRDQLWTDGVRGSSYLCDHDTCCPFDVAPDSLVDMMQGTNSSNIDQYAYAKSFEFRGIEALLEGDLLLDDLLDAMYAPDPRTWLPTHVASLVVQCTAPNDRDRLIAACANRDEEPQSWLFENTAPYTNDPTTLGVLALLAHWKGDGTLSRALLDRQSHPTSLGQIVGLILDEAMPPRMTREAMKMCADEVADHAS